MKRLIFMGLLLLGVALSAQAQAPHEQGTGFVDVMQGRVTVPVNGHKEVAMLELENDFGYSFNRRWTAYLPVTYTLALFDKQEGIGRYEECGSVGLGVGFNAMHTARERLEVVAKGGGSLFGCDDWKSTYCDLGVRYGGAVGKGSTSLFTGIGVRYIGTTKGNMGHYCSLYLTIGLRFN